MTPETAHTLAAIATIIDKLGALPIGTLLIVIIFGPWIFTFVMERAHEKRITAVEAMYKSNVKLVEGYAKLADGLNDVITLNTAKWSEAVDKIITNQYCPLARVKKTVREDMDG